MYKTTFFKKKDSYKVLFCSASFQNGRPIMRSPSVDSKTNTNKFDVRKNGEGILVKAMNSFMISTYFFLMILL